MSDPRSQTPQRSVINLQQYYSKFSKLLFKMLLGLIFLAFAILFIMILIKLPGSF